MALIEQHVDCHLAVITLNDGEHGNLLGPQGLESLAAALDRSRRDAQVRAILLRSSGPSFCLGMDLAQWAAAPSPAAGGEAEKGIALYSGLLQDIFSVPLPVICLVEGEVKAGGVGLVCASDIVVAGEQAAFELGEVIFGLIPANVLPYMLSLRMPPQKARYLVMTSRRLSAAEALAVNLVDEVVPAAEAGARVRMICARLLRSSPRALAAAKEFTAELIGSTPAEAAALARARLLSMMRDPAVAEGVRAFQEGDVPAWFTRFKPEQPLSISASRRTKE